jgi:hypothetical protein
MIDIDSVEICSNKGCWQPLAIIENVYDVGKYNKYTTVVEFIAEKLGIPAYLVYYKPSDASQQSLEFKIMRLKPFKSVLEGVYEEDWLAELRSLQDEHRKVCKHNK